VGSLPEDEAEFSLPNVVLNKIWMMDNVQKVNNCIIIPSP
jgi:hypothetical protein